MRDRELVKQELKAARKHVEWLELELVLGWLLPRVEQVEPNWLYIYAARKKKGHGLLNIWCNGPKHGDTLLNNMLTPAERDRFNREWLLQEVDYWCRFNPRHQYEFIERKVIFRFETSDFGYICHVDGDRFTADLGRGVTWEYTREKLHQELDMDNTDLQGQVMSVHYLPFRYCGAGDMISTPEEL